MAVKFFRFESFRALNASFLEGKINVKNKIKSLYAIVVSLKILVFLKRFVVIFLEIVFHIILFQLFQGVVGGLVG